MSIALSTKDDLDSNWPDLVEGPIEAFASFFATNSLSEHLSIRFDFKGVLIFRCGCRVTARNYFRRKDGRVLTKLIPKKGDRFTAQSTRGVAVEASFDMREAWSKRAALEYLKMHSARDFMTSGQFIEVLADEYLDPNPDDRGHWWAGNAFDEHDFDVSQVPANDKKTLTEIHYARFDDFDFESRFFSALDCWVENEARERIDLGGWEHVDIRLARNTYSGTLYEPEFCADRLSSEHDLSVDLSIGLSGNKSYRPIADSDVSRLTTVFSASD